MRKHTINVYEYDELKPAARCKAVEQYAAFIEESGEFGADAVIEDFIHIASCMGILIDDEKRIYWDHPYASFRGHTAIKGTAYYDVNCVENVKRYAPEDKELHEAVKTYAKAITQLEPQKLKAFKKGKSVLKIGVTDYRPIDVIHQVRGKGVAYEEDVTALLAGAVKALLTWLDRQLKVAYDHATSVPAIEETFRDLGYEFFADGRIFYRSQFDD